MRNDRRRLLSWGLLYAALFFVGLWQGFAPDFSLPGISKSPRPLTLLAYDSRNLKESFLQEIEELTGIPVELEIVSDFTDFEARLVTTDAPALVWLPPSWARALAHQNLLLGLDSLKDDLNRSVSSDFRRNSPLQDWTEVPLLWAIRDGKVHIEALALTTNSRDSRRALQVMKAWIRPEIAVRQVVLGEDASALRTLDDWDLPHSRRAKSLRDRPFKGLKSRAPTGSVEP